MTLPIISASGSFWYASAKKANQVKVKPQFFRDIVARGIVRPLPGMSPGQMAGFLWAIARLESGFDPVITHHKTNAFGLWQFLPKTWAYLTNNTPLNADPYYQAKVLQRFIDMSYNTLEKKGVPGSLNDPFLEAMRYALLHHAGVGNFLVNRIGPKSREYQVRLGKFLKTAPRYGFKKIDVPGHWNQAYTKAPVDPVGIDLNETAKHVTGTITGTGKTLLLLGAVGLTLFLVSKK